MTKHYGLIGYPLGHSLSPQIHRRLFELAGIEAEYELIEIPPEKLKDNFAYLKTLDGFNITIPHKIPIIELCDGLSEGAQRYGSVNCIMTEHGTSIGYNTDKFGFVKSIEHLGAALTSRVCLLGCGGVGRMMAIEAACLNAELTFAVREEDIPVAEGIRKDINGLFPHRTVNIIRLADMGGWYDLVIYASPVGMFPKTEFSPLKKEQLEGVKYLFDAIYNPTETLLFRYAEELGVKAVTGMSMLVLQAVSAHEIWNHSKYEQADIERLIADMEALV